MTSLKTDNCCVQYKCANVFGMYKDLVKETGKAFIIYYGASGLGCGQVDEISSFGIKKPLRQEIITPDVYWVSASDLVDLFNDILSSEMKIYSELTKENINSHIAPSHPIGTTRKCIYLCFNLMTHSQ